MIKVEMLKNSTSQLVGFRIEGHAGYAKAGKDIVCAGVSTLAINTINSIEAFTETKFNYFGNVEDGLMMFTLVPPISSEAELLLKSFQLGVKSIADEYGKYVNCN